jgi:hypothetical protein
MRWGPRTSTDLPVAEQPLALLFRSRRRRGHHHCFPRMNRCNPGRVSRSPRGKDTGTPTRTGEELKEGSRKEAGRGRGGIKVGGARHGRRGREVIYTDPGLAPKSIHRLAYFLRFYFLGLNWVGEEMGMGAGIQGEMPALTALHPHLLSLSPRLASLVLLPCFPFQRKLRSLTILPGRDACPSNASRQ